MAGDSRDRFHRSSLQPGWNASGAFTIARRDLGLNAASHHRCLWLAGPQGLLLAAMRARTCELPVLAGAAQADPVADLLLSLLAEGGDAFGGRGPGVAGPPGIGLPSAL
jgi:hypothetical protein